MPHQEDSWVVDVSAGSAAGMAGVFAAQPLDFAKVRLQAATSAGRRGVVKCLYQAARAEGVTAWYKGMAVPLASQLVIQGTVFGVFGTVYREISHAPRSSSAAPDHTALFVAGAAAGLVQSPLMTAVERVKIKLQMQRAATRAAAMQASSGAYGSASLCLVVRSAA